LKALVVDCAVSKLSIAAKNEDKICTASYDIGMKQSEILIKSIDYVLSMVDLKTSELNYTALTIGPGSFTGLRLGISALKAIQLAYNIPVYGISSLDLYSYLYEDANIPVLSVIDAHKDKYYVNIVSDSKKLFPDGDYELPQILNAISSFDKIIIAGPDSNTLKNLICQNRNDINILCEKYQPIATESLFYLAEKEIAANNPPLQDYDGPIYLRASEAEINLQK